MYFIGIDPDKGWAEWDGDRQEFIAIETVDFFKIIEKISWLRLTANKNNIVFFVEAPYKNIPTFNRKEISTDNIRIFDAKAQRVGANKEKAKLIVGYINHCGFKCYEIKPNKYSFNKLTAEKFFQITGYKELTSEHGRDAAMLVYMRK